MKLFRNVFVLMILGAFAFSLNSFAYNPQQKATLIENIEKLNLTAEQKQQLAAIKSAQTADYKASFEQLKQINKQLHALPKDKVLDEKKLDQLISQKKELLGRIMKRNIIVRHQVTQILTTEQSNQLHQMMKKKPN